MSRANGLVGIAAAVGVLGLVYGGVGCWVRWGRPFAGPKLFPARLSLRECATVSTTITGMPTSTADNNFTDDAVHQRRRAASVKRHNVSAGEQTSSTGGLRELVLLTDAGYVAPFAFCVNPGSRLVAFAAGRRAQGATGSASMTR